MEQHVSEQYDEQQELSEQSEGDAGLQAGQSPDPERSRGPRTALLSVTLFASILRLSVWVVSCRARGT